MKIIRIAFASILFLFLLVSLIKTGVGFRNNLQFYQSYKSEYDTLSRKNTELKTEKIRKTDLHEVEKTIRDKLGLVRENEIAIIIPPPPTTPTPSPTPKIPPYSQWLALFF